MSYNKTETRELNTSVLNEEKLDVIEILDHRALFSNGRIKPEQRTSQGTCPVSSAMACLTPTAIAFP